MEDIHSLVWMRRDLRLHDHACLHMALKGDGRIAPVFVFDTDILTHFPDAKDRRVSFLARRLCVLDDQLKLRGGGMLVLHGSAREIMPKLAAKLRIRQVVAAQDVEPSARERDDVVKNALPDTCRFMQPWDHLIQPPHAVLKDDGTPYKVFTPFSRRWKAAHGGADFAEYTVEDGERYADVVALRNAARDIGLSVLEPASGVAAMLEAIGYEQAEEDEWYVGETHVAERLKQFARESMTAYKDRRDYMAVKGTSKLSPYLRFGLVSPRECARYAAENTNEGSHCWLNELIWRDFYAMILFHFPDVVQHEFQELYRNALPWSQNATYIEAFQEGRTGYPVVDAAMRELNQTGWMHNRARMIVASFATKHLKLDWRIGEAYFAQKLMDYDLASNNGGWQWAASTGTDAQPYFRVFNPTAQGEKFDPEGEYVRRFVPELKNTETKYIHAPEKLGMLKPADYPKPIVEHKAAREAAIAMFKEARQ